MGEVLSNPSQTFGMINADIEFLVSLEDGSKAPLSHGRYGLLMEIKPCCT